MKSAILSLTICFAMGAAYSLPLRAEEPLIPPSILKIRPVGMERGTTAVFTVDGRNLFGARKVLFDARGIHGTLTHVIDVPEVIAKARAGVDLEAQVPLGKKQTAKLEITVPEDVAPGIYRLRVQTSLGTTNTVAFAVGALPEVGGGGKEATGSNGTPLPVKLPVTLVGTITTPGNVDRYQFNGKAGEKLVFQVQASQLGSELQSELLLSDASGHLLAQAGKYENGPDAKLIYQAPQDGKYILSITDREKSGGIDHFYRVSAGPLPYITGVFPLGVRAGEPSSVLVSGVNLGNVHQVTVHPPDSVSGWTTMPLQVKNGGVSSLNQAVLAVGNEPEIFEREPNNSVAQAQAISLPVTVNGHIDGGTDGNPDADYFRFHARKGEQLEIEVAAARLGSALDSVIEVLDAQGHPVPRATLRCLYQTTTTLFDRDSTTPGIRLTSTSGFHEGDYVMVGDELDRIDFIPDQPDADTMMKTVGGLRSAFLGSTPDVHPINTLVYKVQILPPGKEFPPNGLPVFHLTWRNDDGGPGYQSDSKLDFVAPEDGDYVLHLSDVRGMQGPNFPYRLTIRDISPDYQLWATPENPNVPRGGSMPLTVSVDRLHGDDGPIDIAIEGLPPGITASPATIPQGQDSTVVILSAAPATPLDTPPSPIRILGHARIHGQGLIRVANVTAPLADPGAGAGNGLLQVVSVIPPPDVVVATDSREVVLEPGKDITVTLHVIRQNGFKGRVPCSVLNLPPGVRVVNTGIIGVVVPETQSSHTFVLRAADWVRPLEQPIYVVGQVESDSPTMHPSPPLLLKVEFGNQSASMNRQPAEIGNAAAH